MAREDPFTDPRYRKGELSTSGEGIDADARGELLPSSYRHSIPWPSFLQWTARGPDNAMTRQERSNTIQEKSPTSSRRYGTAPTGEGVAVRMDILKSPWVRKRGTNRHDSDWDGAKNPNGSRQSWRVAHLDR